MGLGWGKDSEQVAELMNGKEWVIEGVAAVRGLRKWRDTHPGEKIPVDRVIHLKKVHRVLDPGAVTMGKGHDTILAGIISDLPKIEARGDV